MHLNTNHPSEVFSSPSMVYYLEEPNMFAVSETHTKYTKHYTLTLKMMQSYASFDQRTHFQWFIRKLITEK